MYFNMRLFSLIPLLMPVAAVVPYGSLGRPVLPRAVQPRDTSKTVLISADLCLHPDGLNVYYCTNITVGTPPSASTSFLINFVWGELFVYGYECEGTCTVLQGVESFNTSNGDGSYTSGSYSTDTFTFLDSNTHLTIPQLQFANVTDSHITTLTGSVGIGYYKDQEIANGDNYPTFVQDLASQGTINSNSYSFWLDDESGESGQLLLGGVDETAYEGNLLIMNTTVQYLGALDGTQPTIMLSSISLVEGSSSITQASDVYIMAGRAANTVLDPEVITPIWNAIGVTYDSSAEPIDQIPYVPCSWSTNTTTTIHLTFGLGLKISVPLGDLIDSSIIQVPANETTGTPDLCILKLGKKNPNWYGRLGHDMWRRLYTVYDFQNNQISLAANTFNATKTNFTSIPAAGVAAIGASNTTTATLTPTPTPAPTSNKLAIGVGLGVGIPVALILLGLAVFCCFRRRKQNKPSGNSAPGQPGAPGALPQKHTSPNPYSAHDPSLKGPYTSQYYAGTNSTAHDDPNNNNNYYSNDAKHAYTTSAPLSGLSPPSSPPPPHSPLNTGSEIQHSPVYHEMPAATGVGGQQQGQHGLDGFVHHHHNSQQQHNLPGELHGSASPSPPEMSPVPGYHEAGWSVRP